MKCILIQTNTDEIRSGQLDKIDRIKELVDVLQKASIAYYRDDNNGKRYGD